QESPRGAAEQPGAELLEEHPGRGCREPAGPRQPPIDQPEPGEVGSTVHPSRRDGERRGGERPRGEMFAGRRVEPGADRAERPDEPRERREGEPGAPGTVADRSQEGPGSEPGEQRKAHGREARGEREPGERRGCPWRGYCSNRTASAPTMLLTDRRVLHSLVAAVAGVALVCVVDSTAWVHRPFMGFLLG